MNPKQVIIFARAPRLGSGKRRLARDVGDRRAYHFYKANLLRLIRDLSAGPWQLHVAVATEQDRHHPAFRHLSVIVQPEGDLGHRMSTVLLQFNSCARLIVGSDIPDLNKTHVSEALATLSTHRLVFGPAVDGGFWGVGCGPLYTPGLQFMRDVRWSGPNALSDTLASIEPGTSVAQVACLADVDDAASFARYMESSAETLNPSCPAHGVNKRHGSLSGPD